MANGDPIDPRIGDAGKANIDPIRLPEPVYAGSSGDTPAVTAVGFGEALAADFAGDVKVTGDIHLSGNILVGASGDIRFADCSEQFGVIDDPCIEPGTVLVVTDNGMLRPSAVAYDKRVAGVVSGAGDYRPGLTLDVDDSVAGRLPVALLGKVYCLVDATRTPI
jgi:hypothetical protein